MGAHLSAAGAGAALALTAAAGSLALGTSVARGVLLLLLAILIATRGWGRAAGYAATAIGAILALARVAAAGPVLPDAGEATSLILLGVIGAGIAAWIRPRPVADDAPTDPRRLKEEFLATVSHELRTPLNAILGWTALLRTPRAVPAQQMDRGLEVIERNARRQLALVEELIAAAEPETSPEHWERLDVNAMLGALITGLQPVAATAGVRLVVEEPRGATVGVPAGAVWVRGDASSLRLALRHVLDNAIKYTPSGGEVCARLRECGDRALIFVTDTGGGVEGRVDQVFEPFTQADGTVTRRYGGLGLGLTIARKLIERHGGHVDLRSDGASGGSTVLITLPVDLPAAG